MQPPPAPQPMAQPPPRKSKAPLIIGIIAAVLLVLCGGVVACIAIVGDAVDEAVNSPPGGTPAPAQPTQAAGLDQPVRDGDLEFTVTNVECGIETVGNEPITEAAQGQFCKVPVRVTNISTDPATISDANQYAYNGSGSRYEADSTAALALGEESNVLFTPINPGNTVNGVLLFDIPDGESITTLELHDSPLSNGVTVTVS
jgi:hypothetical protein